MKKIAPDTAVDIMSLKVLNSISNRIKYPVYGYIRQQNKILSIDIPFYIQQIILLFYFHGEHFEKAGDDLSISDNKMTVTRNPNTFTYPECNNAYTKNWIESIIPQTITWSFTMTCYLSTKVHFSLVSMDRCCNAQILRKSDQYCQKLEEVKIAGGEQFEIKLNTSNGNFYSSRNINLKKKVYVAKNINYKLAITLFDRNSAIELTDCVNQFI